MPLFHYRALQPSGIEISGELLAEDARDAASRLQQAGNYPIEISVGADAPARSGAAPATRPRAADRGRRVPAGELILFTRQLAVLAGAGVALDRALALIAARDGQARRGDQRARLAGALVAALNRGESLSHACRAHPGLPAHYAMVIAAGEAHGDLADALTRLATVLERGRAAARALLGALIYPVSVLVVAFVSVAFLLGFVVPRFEVLLTSLRHEPPLAMQILLALSAAFQVAIWPALGLFAATAAGSAFAWRDPRFRMALDRILLRLPLLGPLLRKVEAERLAFLLGNLIAAGVAVPPAVAATADATPHETVRAGLADAEARIERGDRVSAALAASGVLPEMACELVRVGEETGDLAGMLLKAGEMLQGEVEATSTQLMALITPISIALLGLLIGGIAVAMLGTILEVYDFAS